MTPRWPRCSFTLAIYSYFTEILLRDRHGESPFPRARGPQAQHLLVDQRKLDAAKTALGALTETATIDADLDFVVFRTEVFGALDRVAADGGFAPAGRRHRAG